MSSPWKLSDWNEIIDKVNTLAQNPDSGCNSVSQLERVNDPHLWSVNDIQQVRDKLTEICKDNTFSTELRLWSQKVIDEINIAIAKGWCGCCDETCHDEDGVEIKVYTSQPIYDCSPSAFIQGCCSDIAPSNIVVKDLINGLQVAKSGFIGRKYVLYQRPIGLPESIIALGEISCDGKILSIAINTLHYSYIHVGYIDIQSIWVCDEYYYPFGPWWPICKTGHYEYKCITTPYASILDVSADYVIRVNCGSDAKCKKCT